LGMLGNCRPKALGLGADLGPLGGAQQNDPQ
jgi:hypothetical protein